MHFDVPADNTVTMEGSEKKDEHLELARELKRKLMNMKVTVTSTIIGALGTVTKGLV